MTDSMERRAREIVDKRADGLSGLSATGYGGLVSDIAAALRSVEAETIERCARMVDVADSVGGVECLDDIASAIRSLATTDSKAPK